MSPNKNAARVAELEAISRQRELTDDEVNEFARRITQFDRQQRLRAEMMELRRAKIAAWLEARA